MKEKIFCGTCKSTKKGNWITLIRAGKKGNEALFVLGNNGKPRKIINCASTAHIGDEIRTIELGKTRVVTKSYKITSIKHYPFTGYAELITEQTLAFTCSESYPK